MSSRALVVGNGKSRLGLNLNSCKENFTLVGCNALHRDIEVPYLVCCDRQMALEAVANKKNHNTVVYTRARWLHWSQELRVLPALPYVGSLRQDQPLHWGSGVYAVLLACFLGFKEIYIVGFDLYGNFGKINNIYEGSTNYKQQNSSAIDPALWIYQLSKIFQTHEHTNFYIVNSLDWQFPEKWKYPNVYFKNILAI